MPPLRTLARHHLVTLLRKQKGRAKATAKLPRTIASRALCVVNARGEDVMPDLSISFDGVSHAEASRLAQRLLRDYAREGGNAERVAVTRNDPETQSGGIDVVMHLFDT